MTFPCGKSVFSPGFWVVGQETLCQMKREPQGLLKGLSLWVGTWLPTWEDEGEVTCCKAQGNQYVMGGWPLMSLEVLPDETGSCLILYTFARE